MLKILLVVLLLQKLVLSSCLMTEIATPGSADPCELVGGEIVLAVGGLLLTAVILMMGQHPDEEDMLEKMLNKIKKTFMKPVKKLAELVIQPALATCSALCRRCGRSSCKRAVRKVSEQLIKVAEKVVDTAIKLTVMPMKVLTEPFKKIQIVRTAVKAKDLNKDNIKLNFTLLGLMNMYKRIKTTQLCLYREILTPTGQGCAD